MHGPDSRPYTVRLKALCVARLKARIWPYAWSFVKRFARVAHGKHQRDRVARIPASPALSPTPASCLSFNTLALYIVTDLVYVCKLGAIGRACACARRRTGPPCPPGRSGPRARPGP